MKWFQVQRKMSQPLTLTPSLHSSLDIMMKYFSNLLSKQFLPSLFLQSSASECILVSMLAARAQAIRNLKKDYPDMEDSAFLPRLVAYCSQEAHSCVEKAAMICLVKLRILEPDERCSLRGATLREVRFNCQEYRFEVQCATATFGSGNKRFHSTTYCI